jgi:hypothetical protein
LHSEISCEQLPHLLTNWLHALQSEASREHWLHRLICALHPPPQPDRSVQMQKLIWMLQPSQWMVGSHANVP